MAPASVESNPRVALAVVSVGIVGLGTFVLLLAAGLLLYDRLWSGSSSILVAVCLAFGGVGAYAGWLLGVIVFSATRGED